GRKGSDSSGRKNDDMRILITNDDDIEGEGLRLLASWARKIGEITVVAPKEEQSACSQMITLRRPFEFKEGHFFDDLGIRSYTVDSTPADCVRIAANRLGTFDLVFSGINRGFNTGHFIAYSGTCAAMFEAFTENMPAVAFSTDVRHLKDAAAELDRVWEFFETNRLLEKNALYNVNIPPCFKGFKITRQQPAFSHDDFIPSGEDLYLAKLYLAEWSEEGKDLTYDMDAFFAGYCSVTPMRADRTDDKVFGELSALNG
ncbi:MAG: 5'/3'-nucleotidase SurE, partial [Lachnospiraceae bacterium]|nr:5'/3'-nucleotidase SurE [Lachnospiraceae bacterium]